jgi:hypothetical protein
VKNNYSSTMMYISADDCSVQLPFPGLTLRTPDGGKNDSREIRTDSRDNTTNP